MRRTKLNVLREEYLVLTGDHVSALLLNRLVYLYEIAEQSDLRMAREKEARDAEAPDTLVVPGSIDWAKSRGWTRASSAELRESSLLHHVGDRTIREKMLAMVEAGYVEHAPGKTQDQDRWRINVLKLQAALLAEGFTIPGYTFDDRLKASPIVRASEEPDPTNPFEDPSVGREPASVDGGGKRSLWEEASKWARAYPVLGKAPDDVKVVSYLLYDMAGIEPSLNRAFLVGSSMELWATAGQNAEVLMRGISAALESGVTLSSPKSFVNFTASAKAEMVRDSRKAARGGDEVKPSQGVIRL